MTVGELYRMVTEHLARTEQIKLETFYNLLRYFHKEAYQRASFYSLSDAKILEPSSKWTFILPDDYGEDISALIVAKDRVFASPIFPYTSRNDYLATVGSNNLQYLNSFWVPTISYSYYIAVPSSLWENYQTVIEAGKEDILSLNVFPPLDTSQYEISLMYYPSIPMSISDITFDYETPLMRKYSDWVLYEMIYRCYILLRDFEAATIFKQLADEKFMEAKANEARERLSPAKTLHLQYLRFRRKPMPGPAVPEQGG